jgi:hypothetical protein
MESNRIVKTIACALTLATASCLAGPSDLAPEETTDSVNEGLTTDQVSKLISAGRAKIGTSGGACKTWVQKIVTSSIAITVPSTAPNQYEWNSSASATPLAIWRASYAVGRFENVTVLAGATWTGSVSVPNWDPYLLVIYGNGLAATVVNGAGTSVAGTTTSTPAGSIGRDFIGAGTYKLKVFNPNTTAMAFTAVVLSRSRIRSDFETARRGDIMQMYMATPTWQPHTAIVQTDFNAGNNNWLDSNWVKANTVGEHTVTLDQMIRWAARSSTFGFTVYRLK